ncbi:2-polyprenyl-6-methoxyphenol hydroxylase-like FAD-dependent oxidoreductase [Antricoccus suffuscus]|uniref:2-polyprenyl-6-methoxyphenol hydroxylase-like FAD-dependent oxidoreductase n=1 Tax=Antricoccus suffuscus TaxID=1629062 RepID=A0A2T0ZTJ4_9ACTN|nr:FAD-dependent monooxygenase [Antricoccus suffuscus]PRZ39680.1 2-polyprenyl-6-methoxyphenol hydroxylase-like FAD-dependent oxidoreductase [Antricoccus suffuscus]
MTASAPRHALISGASVAGPVVAYWLRRAGWRVTIVERASHIRNGGYPIDVRGTAAEVTQRMGVYDQIKDARLTRTVSQVIRPNGRKLIKVALNDIIAGVNTIDVELARGELTQILYDVTVGDVEYVFNDSIASIVEVTEGVHVTFVNADPQTFDVVIGADGIHSTTRRLAFGDESQYIHHLGPCVAIYNLSNSAIEPGKGYIYTQPGKSLSVRRSTAGPARVFAAFVVDDPSAIDVDDVKAASRTMKEIYRGAKWPLASGLVEAVETADELYFDTVSQIKMATWSRGRIGLVGDAAFAPSFLSGQGTSIAILGGYVLATELQATTDVSAALNAYETRLRSFIEKNQALAIRKKSNVLPRDAKSLRQRNRRFVTVPILKRLGLMRTLSGDVREASNELSIADYGLGR